MASRFNPLKADAHWQKIWEERGSFHASDDSVKPKSYVLEMFPYPSGRIHMGHVRNYTMGDVIARYRRAKGYEVLHPMGWDAFGMPAGHAAFENKVHPGSLTSANIATTRAQLTGTCVAHASSSSLEDRRVAEWGNGCIKGMVTGVPLL